ncbi:MAG: hypothetical protein RBR57_00015 [Candidatus Syntrophosphaera sp.]|jgi:F420-0:gamma-glutamyl ligase-like protein|nr:hypothetical protein [Candidatus Syntrophosphaera sp.]
MNKNKKLSPTINYNGKRIERIPVQTKIITSEDNISQIIREYALPLMQKGDILTISETPLAITQEKAVPIEKIKPVRLYRFLSSKVMRVPYGIGLGAPTSMQYAIDECRTLRIFFAALGGGFTKKYLKRSGDFYRLAGKQAALIDGAEITTIEPFVHTVIKGPLHPEKVTRKLSQEFGFPVAIMDINDIGGCWVIGASRGVSKDFLEYVMQDNPQGQSDELTPFCIIRQLN